MRVGADTPDTYVHLLQPPQRDADIPAFSWHRFSEALAGVDASLAPTTGTGRDLYQGRSNVIDLTGSSDEDGDVDDNQHMAPVSSEEEDSEDEASHRMVMHNIAHGTVPHIQHKDALLALAAAPAPVAVKTEPGVAVAAATAGSGESATFELFQSVVVSRRAPCRLSETFFSRTCIPL